MKVIIDGISNSNYLKQYNDVIRRFREKQEFTKVQLAPESINNLISLDGVKVSKKALFNVKDYDMLIVFIDKTNQSKSKTIIEKCKKHCLPIFIEFVDSASNPERV